MIRLLIDGHLRQRWHFWRRFEQRVAGRRGGRQDPLEPERGTFA